MRNMLKKIERGSTAVETALLMPIFLFIVISGLKLLIFYFNNFVLHQAVSGVVREITTTSWDRTWQQRTHSIETDIRRAARDLSGLRLRASDIHICPLIQPNCVANNAGEAGQFVLVTVKKSYGSLLGIPLSLSSRVVSLNERELPT